MNSWSRLCWPTLMSSRSSVRNFLIVPGLPKPGGAVRFDAAGGLQAQQVLGAQVAAVYLQRADVEQAAIPAKGALGVELHDHLRQAVVLGACLGTAGGIAQNLAGFLERQRDAVFREIGAQAEQVAQQVVALLQAAQEAAETLAAIGAGLVAADRDREGRRGGAAPRRQQAERPGQAGGDAERRPAGNRGVVSRLSQRDAPSAVARFRAGASF